MVVPSSFEPADLMTSKNSFANCSSSELGISNADILSALSSGKYQNLTKEECVDTYAVTYLAGRGTLIVLSSNLTTGNNSILYTGTGNEGARTGIMGLTGPYYPYEWMCHSLPGSSACTKANVKAALGNLTVVGSQASRPNWVVNAYTPIGRETFDANHFPPVSDWGDITADILTLSNHLEESGPETADELQSYLDNVANWKNGSWAADVTFHLDGSNCPAEFSTAKVSSKTYSFDGCLSLEADQYCQLFFSLPLALVVIGCNVIKVLCIFFAARIERAETLLTVGDAVSSFLTKPDLTTKGMCWVSRSDMTRLPQPWRRGRLLEGSYTPIRPVVESIRSDPQRLRGRMQWMQVPSGRRWAVTIISCSILLVAAGVLLDQAFSDDGIRLYGGSTDLAYLWKLGLGKVDPSTIIYSIELSLVGYILVANLPQLLISISYFFYNGTFTSMLSAAEYSRYGMHRKYLRVSWPRGKQRTTYWLSMPYRYSIPLLVVYAVLHWLVSQSLFYVNVLAYDLNHELTHYGVTTGLGYSPISIILAIIVGGVMLLGLIVIGTKRLKSRVPVAAGCSCVISAACHSNDEDAALKPVMWGEILEQDGAADDGSEGSKAGHCSFASEEVVIPSKRKQYA
ncbi:hypothetical protein ASPWEDRAFT_39931 [Aspergillus wentii DTO 134E9]|uniref:Uncharacterized protein n=1 Tax=Aspergillus wentii DTO 134E9 TaxID=1073089 RepID=A0A1L9RIU0_ASPWE|nr:uncharacterized protein ASPWEDRAFT_39931 [Aspergillus wentii DTO 134E9]OJJ34834.1 hypothetical protein ASPWEDRAFT_39931 [Aspergillus wentii DTO 134E9]